MKIHLSDKYSLLLWTLITVIKINYCEENWSMWRNWITVIKFINVMKNITVINIHNWYENTLLWWKLKFIIMIKIHLVDENSSLWWRLIMSAEIHHNDADNWTEWWKMILQMKIYHSDENISQCWSLSLVDLRSPHWPNKLCFTNSLL